MKEKSIVKTVPQAFPVLVSLTKKHLNQLAKLYDPATIPVAKKKGDENYLVIHNMSMDIVKHRSRLEKVRKSETAEANAHIKTVNGEAKEIRLILEGYEAPWAAEKKRLDDAEAIAKAEATRIELDRVNKIEARIEEIKAMTSNLLAASADALWVRIVEAEKIIITEDEFSEYEEAANHILKTVIQTLSTAHDEREVFEKGQATVLKQQAEMAEQQAAIAAQQEEIDLANKVLAEEKDALRVSQEAAAAKVIADQKLVDDKVIADKLVADKKVADDKAAAETLAKSKGVKKYLAKRKPQDTALRLYVLGTVSSLRSAADVGIDDDGLKKVLEAFNYAVDVASASVLDLTQDGAK
jgi:hypothetical protein